jgi:polygalacturonase
MDRMDWKAFGAIADGIAGDTDAIQRAIDDYRKGHYSDASSVDSVGDSS